MYDDDTIHNALGKNAMGWYLGNGGGRSAYGLSPLFLLADADPLTTAGGGGAAAEEEEDSTSRATPAMVVFDFVRAVYRV